MPCKVLAELYLPDTVCISMLTESNVITLSMRILCTPAPAGSPQTALSAAKWITHPYGRFRNTCPRQTGRKRQIHLDAFGV